jgi:hypothetical protein
VTSPATGVTGAPDLPEYAPVPAIAKGATLNEHGYHVWQVERNLYAVTDNVYMSAFLTTRRRRDFRRAPEHRPQHPACRGRDHRR